MVQCWFRFVAGLDQVRMIGSHLVQYWLRFGSGKDAAMCRFPSGLVLGVEAREHGRTSQMHSLQHALLVVGSTSGLFSSPLGDHRLRDPRLA